MDIGGLLSQLGGNFAQNSGMGQGGGMGGLMGMMGGQGGGLQGLLPMILKMFQGPPELSQQPPITPATPQMPGQVGAPLQGGGMPIGPLLSATQGMAGGMPPGGMQPPQGPGAGGLGPWPMFGRYNSH